MTEEEELNLQHAVDRHEDAITQDAAALEKLGGEVKLIKERMVQVMQVMSDLHRCVYRGGFSDPELLKAYQRARKILSELGGFAA